MVSNHGDHFHPLKKSGCGLGPLPETWPKFMLYKWWVILTTYDSGRILGDVGFGVSSCHLYHGGRETGFPSVPGSGFLGLKVVVLGYQQKTAPNKMITLAEVGTQMGYL